MVYVPQTITAATPRSARLMRYFETQYSEAKKSVDVHLHDDRYYEKSICNTKYFSASHEGTGSGLDADMIDSKHYLDLIGSILPPGIGFAWNGTDANVPEGWHIGDGSTPAGWGGPLPDTRGRFLFGAGDTHAARTTGGSSSLSDAGGTITIGDHLLTVNEIPNHYHDWNDQYCTVDSWASICGPSNPRVVTGYNDVSRNTLYNHDAADEPHNHGTKDITFNIFSIIPAYVCKYIIFKVS